MVLLYSSSEDLDKYWYQRLQQPNQDQQPPLPGLPTFYVLPKYILLKHGVICICYFPNERKVVAIA
jgi:hypothetical protein